MLEVVLATATEALRHFAVLLSPVLPESSQSIWEQLGESGECAGVLPSSLVWGSKKGGTIIGEVKQLFPRLEKEKLMEEIKKEDVPAVESKPAPAVPVGIAGIAQIGIEDFAKVELRAGQVVTAERVPKADKLLRLTIDLAEEAPRQVLAGIAQYYEPEKLIGRKVIVVANLAPRKLRGFESNGMILAASIGEEGRPVLAGFLEEVPNGARLR